MKRAIYNLIFFWKVRNSKTLNTSSSSTTVPMPKMSSLEYRFAIENGYKIQPKPIMQKSIESYIIIDSDSNGNHQEIILDTTDIDFKPIVTPIKSVHFKEDHTISGQILPDSKYPDSDLSAEIEIEVTTVEIKPLTSRCEVFQKLLHEAPNIPGTLNPQIDSEIFPPWLDLSKIQAGKSFIQRHYFSIIFSHLVSLLLIFTIRPIQAVLPRSTSKVYKANSQNNLIYFQFLNYLLKWYKADFNFADVNTQNEFKSDVKHLRNLLYQSSQNFKKFIPPLAQDLQLANEAELLKFTCFKNDLISSGREVKVEEYNSKPKTLTTINPDVPISQYDLSILNWSFWGFLQIHPKKFGIYDSGSGMDGFVHFWAVLGFAFGLQDSYNLAKLEKTSTRTTNEAIFTEIFKFSFITLDSTTWKLWSLMTQAFDKYFLCVKLDCLVYFIMTKLFQLLPDKTKKNKDKKSEDMTTFWSTMSLTSKIYYYNRNLWLNFLLRSFAFRIILNLTAKLVCWIGWMIYLRPEESNSSVASKNRKSKPQLHVKWSQDSNNGIVELVNINAEVDVEVEIETQSE